MSSILRSSKFFKYFSSFNRSLIGPTKSFNVVPVQSSGLFNINSRHYANAYPKTETRNNTVEKYIRRLDQDVRRSGRVSMRELQEVFDEIKLSNQATSSQSLMIIRCCGNLIPEETPEFKLKLVKDIWDTLVKQGVPMDVSHYNALLMVYLENEHKFSPTDLLAMLNKKGVEPNRVTFQRLIAAYCQQGNIEGATRILEFMKEKQMPISENIFNSLIIGHSHANDMESAKGILGVMQQASIEPSSETYTALMCGYARNGDMNGITETFNLTDSKEVSLHDRQLLEVIYQLSINGHSRLIDVILPRLTRQTGYNQDAKNTILRLIARGQDESAIKVFKTMTPLTSNDEEPLPQGTFILRQMVKMDRPFETIKALCDDLKQSHTNERAFHYATESCLIHGKTELGLRFISVLAEEEPVLQHYYWPLICQYGKMNDHEGIIKTLKQMSLNMNQPVSNETLREYVVEHIGPNEKGILALRQAGVTVASSASAIVAYHLSNMDLASAARIASKYRANFNLVAIRRGVIQSYKTKPDIDNLILIVRSILSNMNNAESADAAENNEEVRDMPDSASSILLGIASSIRQGRADQILQILKGYLEYGIGITTKTAESLQEILSGSDLTPEISNILAQLTSPDLTFIPLQRSGPVTKSVSFDRDEASIIESIHSAEAKEQSPDAFKLKLMSLYCKQQEYAKAAQIRQELTDKKVDIPVDYMVQLLAICVNNENLAEADAYYKEIVSQPVKPLSISELTLVKLATLYINADKFDEALKLFETHKSETYEEKEFSYSSTCWKLLNSVAESGDSDKVEKLFNTMRLCNFIIPTNVLLGPLIKVYLVKNDLKNALDKFEECSTLYRATPWKNELACKLIQAEDAVALQRLTDLSSKVHGEVNSLYDLVLSFIECGRMRQARKILETPGLRTRHSRLSSACLRYQNEGHVNHLENLVEVTKDLPHIDRAEIYYHLLGSYCNEDAVDKAVGLWTQMQEEDVQSTDRFLIRLANLLKKHNKPIPFSVPDSATTDRLYTLQKQTEETSQMKAFRRAVYSKDVDKALEIKQSLLDADLQSSDRSALLTLLINNGRLGETTKLLTLWLEQGLRPNIRTLNYLINTVAKTGDVDTLANIGNMLDDDLKKLTSFTNRYTHCMVEAGKAEEVLQRLEADIEAADTPEKLLNCQKTFPRGGMFSILTASPDNIPRCEKLAMKYKEKGLLEPLNVLWINYFINQDKVKAAEIWPSIKTMDRIMYQPILKKARSDRDLQLAEDLLKSCEETSIGPGALGAVHSCILDVLVMLDRLDDCSAKLDNCLKTIPIENLSYATLRRIRNAFEKQGKLFKYTMPPKPKRHVMGTSSSSDSDSDDEVRQKKLN